MGGGNSKDVLRDSATNPDPSSFYERWASAIVNGGPALVRPSPVGSSSRLRSDPTPPTAAASAAPAAAATATAANAHPAGSDVVRGHLLEWVSSIKRFVASYNNKVELCLVGEGVPRPPTVPNRWKLKHAIAHDRALEVETVGTVAWVILHGDAPPPLPPQQQRATGATAAAADLRVSSFGAQGGGGSAGGGADLRVSYFGAQGGGGSAGGGGEGGGGRGAGSGDPVEEWVEAVERFLQFLGKPMRLSEVGQRVRRPKNLGKRVQLAMVLKNQSQFKVTGTGIDVMVELVRYR
jgi:hypothetical protein